MIAAIPALIAQIGIPLVAKLVGQGLRQIDHPVAQGAADGLDRLDQAVATGDITPDRVAEANRHVERMAELESAETQTALREVNQSLRTEIASEDVYVRRMRPTFGYIMALTWAAQMGAIAYVIVADPRGASAVIADMANLGMIWTMGLSVLGIYVYQRSREKQNGRTGDPAAAAAAVSDGSGMLVDLARRAIGRVAGR